MSFTFFPASTGMNGNGEFSDLNIKSNLLANTSAINDSNTVDGVASSASAVDSTSTSGLAATSSTLSFAGRTWSISTYLNFINRADQTWVDSNGYLHMVLSKASGTWKDVELVSSDVTGYGTYTWVTQGVPDLDKNLVFGLFPYLDNSHEMDQEISRWGDASSPNFAYTVQPDPVVAGVTQKVFELPTTTQLTTYTIAWNPTNIVFTTMEGSTVVGSFTSNVVRDATGTHALMNLWQFSGAPSDGKSVGIAPFTLP